MQELIAYLRAPLLQRQFWVLVALIWVGRMAYFAYWGVLLEIDSVGYLAMEASIYHPPGYIAFAGSVARLTGLTEAVVAAQSLCYAWAAALALWRCIPVARHRRWLAIVLALEPLSGRLACTLMAETLFLALLLLVVAWLPRLIAADLRRAIAAAVAVGLCLGLAYVTRYAAPAWVLAVVLATWRYLPLRRWLLVNALMLLAFQAATLPVRLYYEGNFGTLRFNAFSGLSLWNATAYLYPGSAQQQQPLSGFERRLAGLPESQFDIADSWHTNHIFHESSAFQGMARGMGTAAQLQAGREAGDLGLRLLLSQPIRHIDHFVLPNLRRPFFRDDIIYANLLPDMTGYQIHYQPHPIHVYHRGWAWVIHGLLLLVTAGAVWRRKQLSLGTMVLVLSAWIYLAAIAVVAVEFLRFLYLVVPLLVLAAGMAAWGESESESK